MQKRLHTPDGVRDIYNQECEEKLALQQRLRSVIKSYGYRDIETPTFEFFDVFGSDIGTIPSNDLYKFFDRDGNTLVLRADFTPPVARAASMYFQNEPMTLRLCYLGNTYVNSSSYQGRLKETTQIGGEMIGDDSAEADAEVIALTVQLLKASGLKEFQISLGHCGYFDALSADAGLDDQNTAELRRLISNKNSFGAQKLLRDLGKLGESAQALTALPSLFGGVEVLDVAASLTKNDGALFAVDRLRRIYEILKLYRVEAYVSFDLGLLSNYMYYTGILFRGYTFGTGAAILKGGRYDGLLGHFGKDAPAVGFVAEIDQLLSALSRQKIRQEIPGKRCMILYEAEHLSEAVGRALDLRSGGTDVELVEITEKRPLSACREYAARSGCETVEEL